MKITHHTAHTGLNMMGADFYVTIDFRFTPGCPAKWCKSIGTWDPPEPPEYEIDNIWLQHDLPGTLGPKWEIDGELFQVIAELTEIEDAMVEAAQ